MIHSCKIQCHTMDASQADLLGLEDDGKWLPFSFHMDMVLACKMTTDVEGESLYNCTTLFTEMGESYIIDTPYAKFSKIFYNYHSPDGSVSSSDKDVNDNDLPNF